MDDPTIDQIIKDSETEQEFIEQVIESYLARRTQKIGVKYQRMNEHARVPTRAHWNDAAYDLWAYEVEEKPDGRLMYKTGIKMAMPDNYVGLVFPRSSTSKRNLILGNCVAVFDAGYRGEILIPYKTLHHTSVLSHAVMSDTNDVAQVQQTDPNLQVSPIYSHVDLSNRYEVSPEKPERIAQILFIPRTDVNWEEVDSVDESTRGEGNFGHTGQGDTHGYLDSPSFYHNAELRHETENGWLAEARRLSKEADAIIRKLADENAESTEI